MSEVVFGLLEAPLAGCFRRSGGMAAASRAPSACSGTRLR